MYDVHIVLYAHVDMFCVGTYQYTYLPMEYSTYYSNPSYLRTFYRLHHNKYNILIQLGNPMYIRTRDTEILILRRTISRLPRYNYLIEYYLLVIN